MNCDDLYDEWVHPFLTHQHLVVVIWTYGFAVQVPGDVWSGETSNLKIEKRSFYSPFIYLLHQLVCITKTDFTDCISNLVKVKTSVLIRVWVCDCVTEWTLHLEVNPAEATLLHSEVWRDLHEARSVTFLLDSWSLVSLIICPRVVPPPAAGEWSFIHNTGEPHFQWLNFL